MNEPLSSDCPSTQPIEESLEMEPEEPTSRNDPSSPRNTSEPSGSTKLLTPSNISPQEGPATNSGQIDLGLIIQEVNGSWNRLRSVVQKIPDDKKKQYLSNHFNPFTGNVALLHHARPLERATSHYCTTGSRGLFTAYSRFVYHAFVTGSSPALARRLSTACVVCRQ